MITGEAEDIVDIKTCGPEDVALYGDAVTVPGDHLEHGFDTDLFKMNAGGKGTHAGHGSLVVRDVHGVHVVSDQFALGNNGHGIASPWRAALAGYGHMAQLQYLFKSAWRQWLHT